MRVVFRMVSPLLAAALLVGCTSETVEEYPEGDELPITEPAVAPGGGPAVGTDTVLDAVVIPPPPGTTPP